MGHGILFDCVDWLYVGLFCCDWDVGWGTRGQVPCPKEKQADSLQAIYLFFFFYSVGEPGWDN
jgi:hypothetical protein